jgi:hypothetical protein
MVVLIIFGIGYVYFVYIDNGFALSEAQIEIKDIYGAPEHFIISYLPKGSEEGSEFARYETWFYPSLGQKISFLAGKPLDISELEIAENSDYWPSPYNPEDFDVYTSLSQVKKILDGEELAPLELPGFDGDGIKTYGSAGALFVFENDYLTYVETLD